MTVQRILKICVSGALRNAEQLSSRRRTSSLGCDVLDSFCENTWQVSLTLLCLHTRMYSQLLASQTLRTTEYTHVMARVRRKCARHSVVLSWSRSACQTVSARLLSPWLLSPAPADPVDLSGCCMWVDARQPATAQYGKDGNPVVRDWLSSFLTAHQHITGHCVPLMFYGEIRKRYKTDV